ncbi:MAG TPA: LysR family transcriptional regulator [Holophaga sp.]|nr:LysR family transcriptional regulator [Holophaga sp.]
MDLQLLETFLVVCEERNLSRAARRLFRTQPAITRQIQALESLLGVRLIARSPRGVQPTPEGEELRIRGARILGELRSLKDLGSGEEAPAGELHIACSDNVACHVLAPVLGRYAAACPKVQVRLVSGVTPGIANLVERGACELGFVMLPLRNPRLALHPVLTYRQCAVFPPGGAPEDLQDITVERLCGMPLVLLVRETATRRAFDEMVDTQGLQPRTVLEVGSIAIQKAMVRAGAGAGILPDYTLEAQDGLPSLPLRGAKPHTLALCHLKERPLSLPARHLLPLVLPGGGDHRPCRDASEGLC